MSWLFSFFLFVLMLRYVELSKNPKQNAKCSLAAALVLGGMLLGRWFATLYPDLPVTSVRNVAVAGMVLCTAVYVSAAGLAVTGIWETARKPELGTKGRWRAVLVTGAAGLFGGLTASASLVALLA